MKRRFDWETIAAFLLTFSIGLGSFMEAHPRNVRLTYRGSGIANSIAISMSGSSADDITVEREGCQFKRTAFRRRTDTPACGWSNYECRSHPNENQDIYWCEQ